jgi:hypothetical protein
MIGHKRNEEFVSAKDIEVSFVALAMIFEILNGCYQIVLNACLERPRQQAR